jgi:flagellar protein FlaG
MVDQISLAEAQGAPVRAGGHPPQTERSAAPASPAAPQETAAAARAAATAETARTLKAAAAERQEYSEEQRRQAKTALGDINEMMAHFNKSVRFALFEESGKMYAQVVNIKTDEVIKTIPSEEALETMMRVHEVLGMLIDEEG